MVVVEKIEMVTPTQWREEKMASERTRPRSAVPLLRLKGHAR
jgi:hypothetical protein